MAKFIMITGGARSGKSTYAESRAKELSKKVVYIATAIPFDEGMQDRIERHKDSRPAYWSTLERYKDFQQLKTEKVFIESDTFLLDCVTLMVSNHMLESGVDFDTCSLDEVNLVEREIFRELNSLLDIMLEYHKNLILVTNEVGMGLVPSYKLGSYFRDIAGRINQYLAQRVDEVSVTISGIPLRLK